MKESNFKVGDIVVDEDYIPDFDREGVVEKVCDGFCCVTWNINVEKEYFSTTNFEWLKRKEDRLKELDEREN